MTWAEPIKISFVPKCPKKCCRRCRKSSDDDVSDDEENLQDEAVSKYESSGWEHINLVIEELPQFLILMLAWGSLSGSTLDCDPSITSDEAKKAEIYENCTEEQIEYSRSLGNDAIVSLLFTSFSLIKTVTWYTLFCFKRYFCRKHQGDREEADGNNMVCVDPSALAAATTGASQSDSGATLVKEEEKVATNDSDCHNGTEITKTVRHFSDGTQEVVETIVLPRMDPYVLRS